MTPSTPLYPAEWSCISYKPICASKASYCTSKTHTHTHIHTHTRARTPTQTVNVHLTYATVSHRLNLSLKCSIHYRHTCTLIYYFILKWWSTSNCTKMIDSLWHCQAGHDRPTERQTDTILQQYMNCLPAQLLIWTEWQVELLVAGGGATEVDKKR
jgi:hypothetical protein